MKRAVKLINSTTIGIIDLDKGYVFVGQRNVGHPILSASVAGDHIIVQTKDAGIWIYDLTGRFVRNMR